MIKVNGEIIENIAGKNIAEYLTEGGYDLKRVAVELNEDIAGIEMPFDLDNPIAAAIAKLPAQYRDVLLLRFDNGFTTREIASMLNITDSGVRKLIARAKRALQEILAKEGFVVMPYMYPDLNAARDMVNAGAATIMPLASPIGSNKGLATKEFIQILIDEIDLPIIVDAGIGRPSQACEAMEMGAAAIMANTALATAGDLPMMAAAFRQAIEAGRQAYLSGLGRVLTRGAAASDPLTGFLRD